MYRVTVMIIQQSIIGMAVVLPILIGIFLVLPTFVEHFLPDYLLGVSAAQILLVGLIFLPIAGAVGNFLNTVNKQIYYTIVQGIAIFLNLGFGTLLVNQGMGIEGVAWGVTLTIFVYVLLLVIIALFVMRSSVIQ